MVANLGICILGLWRCFANNYLHWAATCTWLLLNLQGLICQSTIYATTVTIFIVIFCRFCRRRCWIFRARISRLVRFIHCICSICYATVATKMVHDCWHCISCLSFNCYKHSKVSTTRQCKYNVIMYLLYFMWHYVQR